MHVGTYTTPCAHASIRLVECRVFILPDLFLGSLSMYPVGESALKPRIEKILSKPDQLRVCLDCSFSLTLCPAPTLQVKCVSGHVDATTHTSEFLYTCDHGTLTTTQAPDCQQLCSAYTKCRDGFVINPAHKDDVCVGAACDSQCCMPGVGVWQVPFSLSLC